MIDKIFDVKGKVIVIMGGGGKMGQQFSDTLSKCGAEVIVSDLKRPTNHSIEENQRLSFIKCDVNVETEIVQLFSTVFKKYNHIDVLIYNVMAKPEGYYKSFEEYTVETFNGVINANLTGAFIASREVTKYMKQNTTAGGSIVLTSSVYGMVGPDQGIYKHSIASNNIYSNSDPLSAPISYSASKSGIIGMTQYLATLLGEYNIRVNSLVPGGVYDGQDENFCKEYNRRTPLGRMAKWDDYNGAILFLSSTASQYMTGAKLVIDGGWTAW